MIRRALLTIGCFALGAACNVRCGEGAYALPLEGAYEVSATYDNPDVTAATLDVESDSVVLEYSRPDGSRFRATYRVREKLGR